jgi:hypothetical protein
MEAYSIPGNVEETAERDSSGKYGSVFPRRFWILNGKLLTAKSRPSRLHLKFVKNGHKTGTNTSSCRPWRKRA